MNLSLVVLFAVGFEWILFSVALWKLSGKLKWEKRWKAWIPGLRFFALGDSIGLNKEGTFCGILEILFIAGSIIGAAVPGGRIGIALSLATLVLFTFFFIYRIRIFLRILDIFGLRRRWLILWLIANWLPMLIIGFGGYEPKRDLSTDEHWQAGTAPAQIPGAEEAGYHITPSNEGLSIDLRERSVKESRKKRYLLKDIGMNIPNSSLVMLLGGSGAGKTTFMNGVIGYEKADATVLLNGKDVYKDYNSVKYRIGYVPQQNLMRAKDTVIRTVSDAAKLRLPTSVSKEETREKMKEVMDLLGLSAGCEGLVSKKSGGQLRRISIAMELVTGPELFVLDEPDSGLDGVIAREIFQKLRGIADEGRIVMVITHTPDRVVDLFDKVIVLARDSGRVGRLAFYGSPQEAREFFGKETMEDIVMSVNSRDEGGEGLADEYIERYAKYAASRDEEVAS